MRKKVVFGLLAVLMVAGTGVGPAFADVIRIGVIQDITVGAWPPQYPYEPAEMIRERINAEGGLKVGDKSYQIELVVRGWPFKSAQVEYNTKNANETVTRLVQEDKVFAVLGPAAAPCCLSVADTCNIYGMLNVNYWATTPGLASSRPWVFTLRSNAEAVMTAMARFATEDLKARTAAVLFTSDAAYTRDNSAAFRAAFEKINGNGAVVAWEPVTTPDHQAGKVATQVAAIAESKPDILVLGTGISSGTVEAIKQLRALGFRGPVLTATEWLNWARTDVKPEERGPQMEFLKGTYTYSADFEASLATGAARESILAFKDRFGVLPDVRQALLWDGFNLLLRAIQKTGGLTGDTKKDQQAVRDQLARIQGYPGFTGTISFDAAGGAPKKSVSILKVLGEMDGKGNYELARSVLP